MAKEALKTPLMASDRFIAAGVIDGSDGNGGLATRTSFAHSNEGVLRPALAFTIGQCKTNEAHGELTSSPTR